MMKLTLGGTGTPLPNPDRAGPMSILEGSAAGNGAPSTDDSDPPQPTRIMFDAGRGAVMRLAGAGILPVQLDAVLLTHLHSDHICALNDVVTTYWVMTQDPSQQLTVYGPARTSEMMDGLLAMLKPDIGFRVEHHDDLNWGPQPNVIEVAPGDSFDVGELSVQVGRTSHAPVEPSVAYRVTDGASSVVIAGDGIPCDELDELAQGATAYVQTVLRPELVKLLPAARLQDILEYHSSVEDAARTAARANVAKLVLTHYLPSMNSGDEEEWRQIAAEHFDGEIVLGDDLTAVEL